MNRIEKDWKELDADKVDFNHKGPLQQWTWSRGGRPLEDWEWSISAINEDLTETRYKLPECLNTMLNAQFRYGEESARGKMRNALGV